MHEKLKLHKNFKFAPIVEHFNSVCASIEMDPYLSSDEQVISHKGMKSTLRQYLPMKPKKWGYEVFALSGETRLIHKIVFIVDKQDQFQNSMTISEKHLQL